MSRFPFGRHAEVGVVGRDPLDQLALPALAGDDRLRLEHRLAGVERERALVLAVGVALGAAGLDQRDDVVREIDRLSRRGSSPHSHHRDVKKTINTPARPRTGRS